MTLAEIVQVGTSGIKVKVDPYYLTLYQSSSAWKYTHCIKFGGLSFWLEYDLVMDFFRELKYDPRFPTILRLISLFEWWITKAKHLAKYLRKEEGVEAILQGLYRSVAQTRSKYQLSEICKVIRQSYLAETEIGKRFLEKFEGAETHWIALSLSK